MKRKTLTALLAFIFICFEASFHDIDMSQGSNLLTEIGTPRLSDGDPICFYETSEVIPIPELNTGVP